MGLHALFECHIWQVLLLDINKMVFRVQCIKCYIQINSFVLSLPVWEKYKQDLVLALGGDVLPGSRPG